MHPNVFVSEDFFENFDIEWTRLPKLNIYDTNNLAENKANSLNRIRDLMLASNLYTDVSDKTIIKYHTKQFGSYNNSKDFILHTKVKDASFSTRGQLIPRQTKEKCKKSGFCYFTNNEENEWKEETVKTGKIILGKGFLDNLFYLNHTFGTESTNQTIHQISKLKHPCTGLVIMDRYLFDDTSSQHANKISNLISFLKELIPDGLINPFEIDIITENRSNNSLFEKRYNQIFDAFNGTISLHVYAPEKIEHDRYLITNYAIFSVALPFVGDTNVSCNFFPSNTSIDAIKKSYTIWADKIILALNLIKKTPNSIGLFKSIWKSDNKIHSIFEV